MLALASSTRSVALNILLAALLAWPWSLVDFGGSEVEAVQSHAASRPAASVRKATLADVAPATATVVGEMDDDTDDDSEGITGVAYDLAAQLEPIALHVIASRSVHPPRRTAAASPLQQSRRRRC